MSVRIFSVKKCPSGFGMYQLDPNAVVLDVASDIDDYLYYMRCEMPELRRLTPAELAGVDGHIHDQRGTLLGWQTANGDVSFECVEDMK